MPLSSFQQQQQANRHVEGPNQHVHQHAKMHPHGQAALNGHPAGARYYAQSNGMNGVVVNPSSTRRPEVYDGMYNRWGMHDPRNMEPRGGGMHTHRGMHSAREMELYGDYHAHRSMDPHGGGMHTHRGMYSPRDMELNGGMHTHRGMYAPRDMDLNGGMHTHRGMYTPRDMELNGGMHTHRGMYTPREIGVMHLNREVHPLVCAREQQYGATAASGGGISPNVMQANGDMRNERRIACGLEGGDICPKDVQNEEDASDTVPEPEDNQDSVSKGRCRKRGPLTGQSPGKVEGKSPMNYPLDDSVTSTACDAKPVGQQGEINNSMVSTSSQSRPISVPKLALAGVQASQGAGSMDVSQAPHTPRDVYNADKSPGEMFRGGPAKSPHAQVQSSVTSSSRAQKQQQQQASMSPRMQQPESHRSSRGLEHSSQHPMAYISPRMQPVAYISPREVYVSPRIQPVVYHHSPREAYNSPREVVVPEISPRMRSPSPPALVQHATGYISTRPDTVDLRMRSGWAMPDANEFLRPKSMSSAIHSRDTGGHSSQFDQGRRVPRSTSSVIHLHTPMSQAGGGWREGGGERFLLGDRIEVLNDDRGSYPASPMEFTRSFSMIQCRFRVPDTCMHAAFISLSMKR